MHTMSDESEFCLRWHRHLTNFIESFGDLLDNEALADVYFFAEGQLVKAHKVVLSSCSTYFQSLFKEMTDRHPIIVLNDVKLSHIKALLQFMYRGTVNVTQDSLEPIMKMAQTLNIKGLSDGVVNIEKVEPEEENDHPMSLIHPKLTTSNYNSTVHTASNSKPARPLSNVYSNPPSSVNSVLSSALNMPSALGLTSHLTLPQLASLPPNLASSLASTLSNAIPQSIGSFMPPRNMPMRDGNETPNLKRRRKHSRRSGETLDSGDSDGRSSGSPGDSVPNIHIPKIPATITPIGLHRQQIQSYLNNSQPQQQPRDLSIHSSNNHSHFHTNTNDRSPLESLHRERLNSIKPPPNIPGLLLHPPPPETHKVQDEPENLEHRPTQTAKQVKTEASSKTETSSAEQNNTRSESPNCDKRSPLTSGDRSDGSSIPPRQSPKCGSDPESLASPAKLPFIHSRLDETSSDNNHYSDEEKEESTSGHRDGPNDRLTDSNPGPSTSRPQSEEAPHTPSFLGWPYTSEANSSDENFPNFSGDTNQDYFRGALNLVRAGFSGILPPRMPTDMLYRPSVPLGLPLLLKRNNEMSANNNSLLNYPFPETPRQFTCDKCGRSYASTGNLKRHKKYECGVEPMFSCPICKKKFQHRHSVKIHVFSTHRNEGGDSGDPPRDVSGIFSTADGVPGLPTIGPAPWQFPPEPSTAASQNQEG